MELGEKGDEVGIIEDVEGASESRDESEDDAIEVDAREEEDEGVIVDEGMEERVVGKSPVTVTNVPEAAGAFMNVAESSGRIVEGRWRQYDDSGVAVDIVER